MTHSTKTLGFGTVNQYIERGIIEIAPLAFMRGRTLNESFIILDESQNTTKEQMKMFLTRIGYGSKAVVCGDITQTDLAKHLISGLHHCQAILQDIEAINFYLFYSSRCYNDIHLSNVLLPLMKNTNVILEINIQNVSSETNLPSEDDITLWTRAST